jgi:regulator of sigma E protease
VQTLLAFVFVLGVLIFVHELGHYLMAKRLGVKVLKFSLGFGPRLIGFRRGDTEYCISAIPLGGFVKMAGENPDDPRSGSTDEFLSRSKWERFQILIMGPLMNILLAVVVMALVLMQGADVPAYQDQPPVVGVVAAGSPAERGGIKPQDRIVSVGGRPTDTWDQFFAAIGTRARRNVAIVLLREGREVTVQVVPDAETKYEIGEIGVMPDVHPHIRAVTAGDPADKAGLKAGDLILAVNGETMVSAGQLSNAIATRAGMKVVFTIERAGVRQEIAVTPVKRGSRGVVGIGIGDEVRSIRPTPIQAVWMSLQRNYEFSGLIFRTLVGLLTTETSPRQLVGPVGIAELAGESAAAGWMALLTLLASISLNLGIINLLPIPVLDGGHIFIMAIEGIARRDFSIKVKEKMLMAGFAVLMLLMVTVIYNDLTRVPWVAKLMFWR